MNRRLRAIRNWNQVGKNIIPTQKKNPHSLNNVLLVLPVFALANAGVTIGSESFDGRGLLMVSIVAGLTIGKPLGFALASALAVGLHLAERPRAYSSRDLTGAGALAGVGFTMSLFIAGQAFPRAEDFAVARIAVFAASILSAVICVAVLWRASARKSSVRAGQPR